MPRISKASIYGALEQAARNIVDAAKPDGITSRQDIARKLDELKGTERNLTDMLYRFIDHRDAGAGNRVTAKDVEKAVAYAKEHLIARYDLNNNGLSQAEIARMSSTGKLAVELARELKAVAVADPAPATSAVAEAAARFIRDNIETDDTEKIFPALNSGNSDCNCAYLIADDQGSRLMDVLKWACPGDPRVASFDFDPARHSLFAYGGDFDELSVYIGVVHKQSGEVTYLNDVNFIDVCGGIEEGDLRALFPEFANIDWGNDGVGDYDVFERMLAGSEMLDIGSPDD